MTIIIIIIIFKKSNNLKILSLCSPSVYLHMIKPPIGKTGWLTACWQGEICGEKAKRCSVLCGFQGGCQVLFTEMHLYLLPTRYSPFST